MKNRITSIIILVSFILLLVSMFYGINIGNIKILSISQIKEKNNDLHNKIEEVSTLISKDYPENIEKMDQAFEEYTTTKEKYEQLSGLSKQETIEIYETKQYEISYLWKVLGDYAEKRNLSLGIEVQKSNTNNKLYSFNFSISGEYVNIIQFIKDLENDSDLYFRIYDFKINGSGTNISASFKVENINIDPSTINGAQSNNENLFEKTE